MFPILIVVTLQGILCQMATAQYTILPSQNQPVSNLNRQQLIHTLLTTFDQPTSPQRLELLAAALKEIPPKNNKIYIAELLKQTALQTLKVAASVCNAAEYAENSIRLPQRQITNAGYVLPNEGYNYFPEGLTTSKGGLSYIPEALITSKRGFNHIPEGLTTINGRFNNFPEVLNNYLPRKEVVINYTPEILGNFVPRKEVLTNYLSEVPNTFAPRKEILTNYVPEVLSNFVPRKEVVTNYVPRKDVYEGYSTNLLANRGISSYY